jgi:hypothetical protein
MQLNIQPFESPPDTVKGFAMVVITTGRTSSSTLGWKRTAELAVEERMATISKTMICILREAMALKLFLYLSEVHW